MRIDYVLTLPPERTPDEVKDVLVQLRSHCLDQPFEFVSPIRCRQPARTDRTQAFDLKPNHVVGFWCLVPGGCLDLALYRFSKFRGTSIPWVHEGFVTLDCDSPAWTARYSAIISAFEAASSLGLGVDVEDPCGFRRHHSRERLVRLRRIMDI